MESTPHISVLYKEALAFLAIKPEGVYLDATCGAAGHSAGICQALAPSGRLIAIDQDPDALEIARRKLASFGDRVILARGNFSGIDRILAELKIEKIDGALADLGVSSMQFDRPERGFSFEGEGLLDMRMDPDAETTADDLIRESTARELARIFAEYGEQHMPGRIATAVKRASEEEGTLTGRRLREIVHGALPTKMVRTARVDPATRVFMALRIAVNREFEVLEQFLESIVPHLAPGGRLVIIGFHSLEDRIVKTFFKEQARGCTCPRDFPTCTCGKKQTLRILTRKPVIAGDAEKQGNPRARSAKLRAAEKLP